VPDDVPDEDGALLGGPGRARWVLARVVDVLAFALLLAALLVPHQLARLSPGAFTRVPVEALVGVLVVLVVPWRAARFVVAVAGALLGLLTLGAFFDMGFDAVLTRPFDPVLDWVVVSDGVEFLTSAVGRGGAIAAVVGAVLLTVAVLVLVTAAALRLARLAVRHPGAAGTTTAALTVVWVTCASLGVDTAPGEPVAADSAATAARDRVVQVRAGVQDRAAFAALAAVDRFRNTPADRLLTGLKGKDVLVAFVESYGRSAVTDPAMAPGVNAVLDEGTKTLTAAGFGSRSAFLSSPTAGGGSWLAHSTTLSGLWIDNQQRYRTLVSSDRLTLNGAFHRAGWRTVGIMPGVTRTWPEGGFYGFDHITDSRTMGYAGPHFSWAPMPDQYALAVLQRTELDRKDRPPVMAELPMVSSHAPWAPIPKLVDWPTLGDGSLFGPISASGARPESVWASPAGVRAAYRDSIEYSLSALISWVRTYGDDRTVLVFLGDHQPAPIVTGTNAGRDVPITIVAHDPKVLDQIAGWGWQDGLRPSPGAPVWRMDTFRDHFLSAFSPTTP